MQKQENKMERKKIYMYEYNLFYEVILSYCKNDMNEYYILYFREINFDFIQPFVDINK